MLFYLQHILILRNMRIVPSEMLDVEVAWASHKYKSGNILGSYVPKRNLIVVFLCVIFNYGPISFLIYVEHIAKVASINLENKYSDEMPISA